MGTVGGKKAEKGGQNGFLLRRSGGKYINKNGDSREDPAPPKIARAKEKKLGGDENPRENRPHCAAKERDKR